MQVNAKSCHHQRGSFGIFGAYIVNIRSEDNEAYCAKSTSYAFTAFNRVAYWLDHVHHSSVVT